MADKRLMGIVGVLLSLTLLSLLLPVNSPTGYVSKDLDFTKSIGEYELDLDFTIKKEFDFTIFDKIDVEIERITKECLDKIDRRECIENLLTQSNPLNMKIGPQNKVKAELFQFVEQIKWCKESIEKNCYCDITFDQSTEELKDLYKDINVFKTKDKILFSSINYDFEIELEYHESFKNLFQDLPNGWSNTFSGNNLYFKKDSNEILRKVNDITNLDECRLNQDTFMFSVPSPLTKKHLFYDSEEEKYVFEKPDIEFAILLKDIISPEIVDFSIESVDFSDKKILINIDASEEKDVIDYFVFYSERNFQEEDIWEVFDDGIADVNYFMISTERELIHDYYDYDSLIPDCSGTFIDGWNKYCDMKSKLYDEDGNEVSLKLEEDKTYNLSGIDKFVSLLQLPKETTYYFTVIPMDSSSNILGFDKATFKSVQTKDQLHPSVFFDFPPDVYRDQMTNEIVIEFKDVSVKNIDGSETSDVDKKEYWFFYNGGSSNKNLYLAREDSFPKNPIQITKEKEIIPYGQPEEYCYFILLTDLTRPDSVLEFKELMFNDPYYKNLQLKYECIPAN